MEENPYQAPHDSAYTPENQPRELWLSHLVVIGGMFACAIIATVVVSVGVALFADWVWTRPD